MMTIRIEGLQRLARKLEEGARDKAVKLGMNQSATLLQGWIQRNRLSGPRPDFLGVLTGRLRTSISVKSTEKVGDAYITKIGTNVEYAAAHEFGYPPHNLRARPFMRPAFEDPQNQRQIVSIIAERLNEALARE